MYLVTTSLRHVQRKSVIEGVRMCQYRVVKLSPLDTDHDPGLSTVSHQSNNEKIY